MDKVQIHQILEQKSDLINMTSTLATNVMSMKCTLRWLQLSRFCSLKKKSSITVF